jgi:hypothetical protein
MRQVPRCATTSDKETAMAGESAESAFPYVDRFIQGYGWIEIGDDGMSPSWIRVLDEGGMIWESAEPYATLDEVLSAIDTAIAKWAHQQLGETWFGPRAPRQRRSTRKSADASER